MLKSKRKAATAERRFMERELLHFEAKHSYSRTSKKKDVLEGCITDDGGAGGLGAGSGGYAAAPTGGEEQRLIGRRRQPFAAPGRSRSLLLEVDRLQRATAWLCDCPTATLRQLQEKVLCATEVLFARVVGLPTFVQELLEQHERQWQTPIAAQRRPLSQTKPPPSHQGLNESTPAAPLQQPVQASPPPPPPPHPEEEEDVFLSPPLPLTFLDFLTHFLRLDTTTASIQNGVSSRSSSTHTHRQHRSQKSSILNGSVSHPTERSAPAPSSCFALVLHTGRRRPVAPLTSINVAYGLQMIEEALRVKTTSTAQSKEASTTAVAEPMAPRPAVKGLEEHQALMADIVQWADFFSAFFDEAREGQCRDPIDLYAAILLACASRGAAELETTPAAVADLALSRVERSPYVHEDTCVACHVATMRLEHYCRTYVENTIARAQRSVPGSFPPRQTRFFLGTPAMVWWVTAYLRLYRLAQPTAAKSGISRATKTISAESSGAADMSSILSASHAGEPEAKDEIAAEEVYLIISLIAAEARRDEQGFIAQAVDGALRIQLSCSTRSEVAKVYFLKATVDAALQSLLRWADDAVSSGQPLRVAHFLQCLQDYFPVVPYYTSFFSSPTGLP